MSCGAIASAISAQKKKRRQIVMASMTIVMGRSMNCAQPHVHKKDSSSVMAYVWTPVTTLSIVAPVGKCVHRYNNVRRGNVSAKMACLPVVMRVSIPKKAMITVARAEKPAPMAFHVKLVYANAPLDKNNVGIHVSIRRSHSHTVGHVTTPALRGCFVSQENASVHKTRQNVETLVSIQRQPKSTAACVGRHVGRTKSV